MRNLTLLFSDLKQSTDLYRRVGDLRAFGMVRDHFSALNRTVSSHGGAVVKTIGDAIMASFPEPAAALNAAVSMHQAMEPLEGDLLLKIGVHSGPCIGVELNDRLDYFGQTVNIAARVQGVAAARETVITEEVWQAPDVQSFVKQAELRVERGECDLRGVGRTPVLRLQ